VSNYRKEIEVFWLILFTAVNFGANLGGIATNNTNLHEENATDCTDNTDITQENGYNPVIQSVSTAQSVAFPNSICENPCNSWQKRNSVDLRII